MEVILKIVADVNIPHVAECFGSIGDVVVVSGRQMTRQLVCNADILLVRSITKVDRNLLAGSSVRFVGTATIGVEHVDVDYLSAEGIGFASAPGSNANSVAEYMVAALLCAARKKKIVLSGMTAGIVGAGNVGSRVEKKLRALGMRPVLNDPPLQRQSGDAKYRPLEEIFECDFVTLHTPLMLDGIDRTFHLADEGFFRSLKTGCVFANSSRGAVVDTAALKAAIAAGNLGGAIIDVWENEPNINVELLRMVDISTPHIAGYSLDGKIAGMIMIYRAVCRHFGLEAKYSTADFLPEALVKQIETDERCDDEQETLHQTVQQVYAINRDDFNTREIAMVAADERGRFFDDLRKNYAVRREFQNTRAVVKDASSSLAHKLAGIGFVVEQEQQI